MLYKTSHAFFKNKNHSNPLIKQSSHNFSFCETRYDGVSNSSAASPLNSAEPLKPKAITLEIGWPRSNRLCSAVTEVAI